MVRLKADTTSIQNTPLEDLPHITDAPRDALAVEKLQQWNRILSADVVALLECGDVERGDGAMLLQRPDLGFQLGQRRGVEQQFPGPYDFLLTDEQFRITQDKATERAFTGRYLHNKETGVYACVVCGAASVLRTRAPCTLM